MGITTANEGGIIHTKITGVISYDDVLDHAKRLERMSSSETFKELMDLSGDTPVIRRIG